MKLSTTEEFLLDVYNFFEKTDNMLSFILQPRAVKFMPGVKNPIFKKYRNQKNKIKFNQLIYYAKRKKYITIKNLNGKMTIVLTREGWGKALKTSFLVMDTGRKREDGKWIMLIFDIPEKYRKSRDLLRSILHNLGYKIFQKSVWICPYDVLDKTEKLLRFYSLQNFVKMFLIEEI